MNLNPVRKRPARFPSRGALRALAGPVLIVASVLIVLNGFVFRGLLTTADVRVYWFPNYCFLGKSLASGHIPAWNPFTFSGMPFAADPQSGWMYAPAMLLFSLLRCDIAIRWMIVLQPILAGLGLLWFLRSEGLARAAATFGGVALALVMAGSELVLSLPFSGTLAWTAILLAACSRYFRSRTPHGKLGWLLLTALAWGQLAAAHFSVGVLMGSVGLLIYAVTHLWSRRTEGLPLREGAMLVGGLALALPLVNLAYLWPRLSFVPETSLNQGYARLQVLSAQLSGTRPGPLQIGPTTGFSWPLKLATSPGGHLGAAALALVFAGWWSKRLRPLVAGFTLYAVVTYLLGLSAVARRVPSFLASTRVGDFYLHSPQWFGYEMLLALAVLAALGAEAWRESRSWNSRARMVAPGVLLWWILPLPAGARPVAMGLLWLGAAAAVVVLGASVRRPAVLAALPLVLALELTVNGVHWHAPLPFGPMPALMLALPHPSVSPAADLRAGPILMALEGEGGRYITLGRAPTPQKTDTNLGLIQDHALLFPVQNAGGYSPVQLFRYWVYVRASQHANIRYNRAFITNPTPPILDLLQVNEIIAPAAREPLPGATQVTQQEAWALYRLSAPTPRASVIGAWSVARSSDEALKEVVAPGFDPSMTAIVERNPGLGAGGSQAGTGAAGRATYRALSNQSAVVDVDASSASIVLVRNPFERHWHATVDGRPAPILPADYVMQGIPVPPGHHEIRLTYGDPSIGFGLIGSAIVVGVLVVMILVLRRRVAAVAAPVPNEVPAP